MGKIVRTVVKIAAVVGAVALAIPSGGTSLLAAGLGISSLAASGIVLGLTVAGALLAPKAPKIPNAQRDRLYSTIDPGTPRKMALGGPTALANDIRYEEWSGTNQDYLDRIVCVASHEIQSVDEIWIEDRQAWTLGGGVTATFSGYLTVAIRTVGTSANTIAINGGGSWGSAQRLTGCAYIHLRFKTTGNTKTAQSPFASSVPQRVTIIGNGAKLYDPRLDTTAGGSGTQRSNDQTTWTYSSTTGNNPALQILFYLLGWKIGGKLAIGRGIPPARIDMASFIAAANLCEEAVALAAGGTEQRYRSYGVVSEADAPSAVLDLMLASCAGTLRDVGGQLSLSILHNDLASPVAAFTDDDILGAFNWQGQKGLDESFNQIRGKRTDPSTNSLYQLVDYPAVTLTSPDGLERIHTFDLAMVQSASQAQRLAKQELQRAQYQGVFSAEFKATAWKCKVGDVVTLTFSARGFSAKLFRVTAQTIRMDGVVNMEMREENAAIYAWSAEETAAVTPASPSVFDPLNSPLIQAVSSAALTIRYPGAFPNDPPIGSLYFDATAKQFRYEGTPVLSNGAGVTFNSAAVTDSGWVDVQDTAILAASLTADWPSITGSAKPDDNADVTLNAVPVVDMTQQKTIAADYLGTLIGSMPVTFSPSVKKNGTSIKLDNATTYAITKMSDGSTGADGGTATVDNTNGSGTKGDVTLSAFAAGSVKIAFRLTTSVSGVAISAIDCSLTKEIGAAPGGGSSGGGSKLAQVIANQATSSTTYAKAHSAANPTLVVASGEKLYGSATISYELSGGTGTRTGTFKHQHSPDDSTWTDFAAGETGTIAKEGYYNGLGEFVDPMFGSVTINQTAAVSAGTYYIRTVFVISATGRTIACQGETITYEAKP